MSVWRTSSHASMNRLSLLERESILFETQQRRCVICRIFFLSSSLNIISIIVQLKNIVTSLSSVKKKKKINHWLQLLLFSRIGSDTQFLIYLVRLRRVHGNYFQTPRGVGIRASSPTEESVVPQGKNATNAGAGASRCASVVASLLYQRWSLISDDCVVAKYTMWVILFIRLHGSRRKRGKQN